MQKQAKTNKKGKIVKNGHQMYLRKNPSLLYETWNMEAEHDLVGPQLGSCALVNPTLLLLCACPEMNVETLRILTWGLQINVLPVEHVRKKKKIVTNKDWLYWFQ